MVPHLLAAKVNYFSDALLFALVFNENTDFFTFFFQQHTFMAILFDRTIVIFLLLHVRLTYSISGSD